MQKCPDCGYQLEPFQTECPRCQTQGKPAAPFQVAPSPKPAPAKAPRPTRALAAQSSAVPAMLGGAALFLIPGFIGMISGLAVSGGGAAPPKGPSPVTTTIFLLTIFGLPLIFNGIALITYAGANRFTSKQNYAIGAAAGFGWIMFLFGIGRMYSGAASSWPFIGAMLTLFLIVGSGGLAGADRFHRDIGPPDIPWGSVIVAAISFFIPCIGLALFISYNRNGDEKSTAAGLGLGLIVLIFLFTFVLGILAQLTGL